MAEFYTRQQGNRGESTRLGTKASGVFATVESWTSVIRSRMHSTEGMGEEYETPSGHRARVDIEGKHGGTALILTFDADTIVRHRDDLAVREAIEVVETAFENLDEAAREVDLRNKIETAVSQ